MTNAADDEWWNAKRVNRDGSEEGYGVIPGKLRSVGEAGVYSGAQVCVGMCLPGCFRAQNYLPRARTSYSVHNLVCDLAPTVNFI